MSKPTAAQTLTMALLACTALTLGPASAAQILVEAEGFDNLGGWVIDQQFMGRMGSPVLLAHGLGTPVADAVTTVTFPSAGTYRVWIRTRDWVATWNAPGAPGRFQVLIDGKPLATTFGTEGADWHWQDGGAVKIESRTARLALRDLTGFNGRCDAILFASDPAFRPPNEGRELADLRQRLLGLDKEAADGGSYDLVVVGGGVAGTCAAVSAARLGISVALIQDRPVLGGNSSSEVRVWINGGFQLEPYPAIGEIVAEFYTRPQSSPGPAEQFGDDKKQAVAEGEPNLSLFMEEHVNEVRMESGRIAAVVSQNIVTGRRTRYTGHLFVDCTGDATVGVLAGADWVMKPKERMGASNMWLVEETDGPVAFGRIEWGLNLDGKPFPRELNRLGVWFWETGFDLDPMADAEAIRDHNLRAMFSVWDTMKNAEGRYPNHRLSWAAFIAGKRESRRLLGDVILTGEDVLTKRLFPDACVATTWPIDLHVPDPRYVEAAPDNPFISVAQYDRFEPPYLVPYRILYSRNVPNLFMAGRNVSVTQEALGSVRVMATGGLMGEVVGRAAYLCVKHDTMPRGVYEKHLDEFKELLHHRTRRPVVAPSGQPQIDKAILDRAAQSGEIAGYALSKVQRWLHEKALPLIDAETGLYIADGHWNYRDTAADCYPFLCWAAFVVDKDALDGPVRSVLHAEQRLCNHLDRIPVPYDWQKRQKIEVDYDELIFQASEYVKDGLIAIVEVTGKDEWFDRMLAIEEDIWKHARYDTPHGKIPSKNVEVNGEQLQALARLYTMTGREEFLTWAERLADYYFDQPDFVPERLRDHGCEIIGGLGLLYAVEVQQNRPKAKVYQAKLKHVFDTILAKGCNEDGMMYNHLTRRDGGNGRLSDGWGYNYVGYLCYDMAVGRPVYRTQVERTLRNLAKPAYDNYNWEGNYSIDGFADSIEGAIYLLNRVPVEEGFAWVDREMARSVTRSNDPLQTAELWGTMKLEANGVRTVLMHALMHTQGVIARPWQKGLQLGAVRVGDDLVIVVKSDQDWSGTLCFDIPRHREYMGFAQDWPRMNTLPEWFTVEPAQKYSVEGLDAEITTTGRSLHEGLPVTLAPGQEKHLLIRPL